VCGFLGAGGGGGREGSELEGEDGVLQVAHYFAGAFLERCGRKEGGGGFRQVLVNFVDDLLLALLLPEWPAAEMLLQAFCILLLKDLYQQRGREGGREGGKGGGAESIYFLQSLDLLGRVLSKLRELSAHVEGGGEGGMGGMEVARAVLSDTVGQELSKAVVEEEGGEEGGREGGAVVTEWFRGVMKGKMEKVGLRSAMARGGIGIALEMPDEEDMVAEKEKYGEGGKENKAQVEEEDEEQKGGKVAGPDRGRGKKGETAMGTAASKRKKGKRGNVRGKEGAAGKRKRRKKEEGDKEERKEREEEEDEEGATSGGETSGSDGARKGCRGRPMKGSKRESQGQVDQEEAEEEEVAEEEAVEEEEEEVEEEEVVDDAELLARSLTDHDVARQLVMNYLTHRAQKGEPWLRHARHCFLARWVSESAEVETSTPSSSSSSSSSSSLALDGNGHLSPSSWHKQVQRGKNRRHPSYWTFLASQWEIPPRVALQQEPDLYHVLSTEAVVHLNHALALSRPLLQSFHQLLFRLLALLGQGQAAWRARVMKAFGGILESDPLLMLDAQVKQAVVDRFQVRGMSRCPLSLPPSLPPFLLLLVACIKATTDREVFSLVHENVPSLLLSLIPLLPPSSG